jgi:hypothetical protein
VHENRRYVKLGDDGYRLAMRTLLSLLVGALCLAGPAAALEVPETEGVADAQLHAGPTGAELAFVKGRELWTDSLGTSWSPIRSAVLPDASGRIAGVRPSAVLVESRTGSWLRLYVPVPARIGWRAVRIADAPKRGRLGPAGLTLDRRGRPSVAYSVRRADGSSELWLVQVTRTSSRVRLARTPVTRNGFPLSIIPPAAQPVLMPDGKLRVVQTFSQRGANAIFWRREGDRWWGRVLHTSSLGAAPLPVFAGPGAREEVLLAWTVAYSAQGELHVVLTSRAERSRSIVLHRNATAAGLLLGPNGPEVAANESVGGLTAGLVFSPDVVTGILPSAPIEVDGQIVGYTRDRDGRWQLLLVRDGGLEWFVEPSTPSVRIVLDGPLSGRVEGADGGSVRVYRERPGSPREVVAEPQVLADGRFAASDPSPQPGTHYRFVYQRDMFSFPYAFLARSPLA